MNLQGLLQFRRSRPAFGLALTAGRSLYGIAVPSSKNLMGEASYRCISGACASKTEQRHSQQQHRACLGLGD